MGCTDLRREGSASLRTSAQLLRAFILGASCAGAFLPASPQAQSARGCRLRVPSTTFRRRHFSPCLSVAMVGEKDGGNAGTPGSDAQNPALGRGSAGAPDPSLAAREKVASAIPPPREKSTGTDPTMMDLAPYSMFPRPPDEAWVNEDETVQSGGLALLKLYHESRREFMHACAPAVIVCAAVSAVWCARSCLPAPSAGPVVAHYWYKSCAMCKIMKPVIQRVVREYTGQIYYVDVEISSNKKTMKHAGVRSIPAVQVFLRGKMVSHFSGLQTVSGMRTHFSDAIATPEDRPTADGGAKL